MMSRWIAWMCFGVLIGGASSSQAQLRPTKYYLSDTPIGVAPVRVVEVSPPPVVIVERPPVVHHVQPTPHALPLPEPSHKDPYETPGFLVFGIGTGAQVFFAQGQANVAPTHNLHLSIASGRVSADFNVDLTPTALKIRFGEEREKRSVAHYGVGLGFSYRIGDRRVHPVVGAGLEADFANPVGLESERAFSVYGRFGVEMGFRAGRSAIAVGLDATVHQPIAITQGYPMNNNPSVGFGARIDFRL